MQESKDPAIKLFGQKIPLPGDGEPPTIAGHDPSSPPVIDTLKEEEKEQGGDDDDGAQEENAEADEDCGDGNVSERAQEKDGDLSPYSSSERLAEGTVNPKTPSKDEETAKSTSDRSEKEESDGNKWQEKSPKKPDKILACPRCNSMDTKFCYYNNYNVNQPRYFCKACQRYWTAGGTMRNVPVGAGRRKNKNSSSHYRHISISEALQAARIDVYAPNGTPLKTNGKVLSFGLDAPICDSMASLLNLADEKVIKGTSTRNGFHEQRIPVTCKGGENGDDCSSASSITVSNSMEESGKSTSQESLHRTNGFHPQIPCLAGVPWPYPWNSPLPSPPALCPPGFPPLSFYPAAFWNCGVPVPGNWNMNMNMHWFSPHSPAHSPDSDSKSPTLGKHSRDGELLKPEHSLHREEPPKQRNGCVLVPKTLRIDDPSEAAKSSIWATLGIKNESASGGSKFKAFQAKKDQKNHDIETSPVLRANPAALSRSLNFHENS
ncbi:hypothetical protein L6164_011184 [Bauhinia variegata]|uniref:Uncharacterized protein n=1 Tax=Bauhinia variegata TaxID=167791 RepID=A0ACB9P4Y9_BAUVA|nr:hypothetical protein L6164_011184 [Bauhinia variegata]